MDRIERAPRRQIRCDGCGRDTPGYDVVNYGSIEGGYRTLCGQCFNSEIAQSAGLEGFEHVQFQPVRLDDSTGKSHEFHFRTHLFGPGVALDAFELRDGCRAGYEFQIIGDPEEDLLVLLGRLIERMRRALANRHLVDGELGLRIADHRTVRGQIGWDEDCDGHLPLVTIDGRDFTWEEFGRMVMSFEGWQFKLTICDQSEEV